MGKENHVISKSLKIIIVSPILGPTGYTYTQLSNTVNYISNIETK